MSHPSKGGVSQGEGCSTNHSQGEGVGGGRLWKCGRKVGTLLLVTRTSVVDVLVNQSALAIYTI